MHGSNLSAVPFGYVMEACHLSRALTAPRNNSANLLAQIAWHSRPRRELFAVRPAQARGHTFPLRSTTQAAERYSRINLCMGATWRAWVGSTEWSSAFCWASLQAQLPHSSPFARKGGTNDRSSSLPREDDPDGVELRHHSAAPAAGAARWRLAASAEQMARQDTQQARQMPQAIDIW